MKYTLTTNRGFTVDFESPDFNPAAYVADLNVPTVNMLAIMTMVIQKNNIQSIVPVREEGAPEPDGTKLEILTNSGQKIHAYVENYAAGEVSAEFNNPQASFVLLGNVIIHKNNANIITVV